jgi:hypothetical protein
MMGESYLPVLVRFGPPLSILQPDSFRVWNVITQAGAASMQSVGPFQDPQSYASTAVLSFDRNVFCMHNLVLLNRITGTLTF